MSESSGQGLAGKAVVAAVLAMIAVGMGWLFWARGRAMSQPIPAVALLPFQTDSPGNAYFADGLTIELINSLSKVDKLRVTSWNSAARFRGQAGNLKALRDGLQAAAVVDGSISKHGDRLVMAVKLIDTNNGEVIWQDSLDRPEREVFQIQERIAKGIVYALKVPLRVDPQRILVPVRTDSMPAYEDYLRARAALGTPSREGMEQSAEFAQKAIAADPKFSPAFGLLAANYGLYRPLGTDSLEKAKDLARKAISMDSSSAEAHTALGMALGVGVWDWNAAKLEFQRAMEWSPNSPDAHAGFALGYLMPAGDLDGAEYEARRAVELDRLSFYANYVAAEVMQARGKSGEFLGFLQTTTALCGDCPRARTQPPADFDVVSQAIDRHDPQASFLQSDPQFGKFHTDPRYISALKRLKLRE